MNRVLGVLMQRKSIRVYGDKEIGEDVRADAEAGGG